MPHSTILSLNDIVGYNDNAVVSKTIIKKPNGNVTFFSFDKGEGLAEHSSPFEALVQIIEGKAEIKIGGEPYNLVAGQCIILPANIPHALKATEKFKMMLVMVNG